VLDLKGQLQGLIKLQELDSEIYLLNAEKALKPEQIKNLEAAFEAKKQSLAAIEKQLLDLQKVRKDKEGELAGKDEAIKKLQTQLYSLKTNKEYQAMLQQIQDAKADYSLIEDKILEALEQGDKVKLEADREKQHLKQEEGLFQAEKGTIDTRVKEIDGRLAQLQALRTQALVGLDPKILAQYDRILHSRDGLAIVLVKDNSCGGCNMFVPAQVINLIKMYDNIVTCEVCNRILYVQEGT
jgi:predicted  nucleic acid-binding Zn-ribbon protein